MFKKLTALLTAASLVLGFAGCSKEQSGEQTTAQATEQTTVQNTNSKPDEQNKQSSDLLVPYMAGFKQDEETEFLTRHFYGLMNTDGTSVVEPVYDWCGGRFDVDGKAYYCLSLTDGSNNYEPFFVKSIIVSADGKWQLEVEGYVLHMTADRIVCEYDSTVKVYDYNGKKIFESDHIDLENNSLYSDLFIVYSGEGKKLVDLNGQLIIDKLDYCGSFLNGKAVASYNRDEGYGIITSEGKWSLEPKYDEIADIGCNYFVVRDSGKEYIYDSDLKLLNERELSEDIKNSFLFEVDGKLVRYDVYTDVNSDRNYRDAFTDKRIACGDILATECDEEYGLFYSIKDGKLTMFDINGKLLNERQNTKSAEFMGCSYFVVDSFGEKKWFNPVTHEEVFSIVDYDERDNTAVDTMGDSGLAIIKEFEKPMEGKYHLYDYRKGEYVFKDCRFADIDEHNGEIYITVAYADRVETYDADFNLIIKTENLCEK